MRSTIARTEVSRRACRMYSISVSEPDDGAVDRIVAALAAVDRARRVDDGDARTTVQAERRQADARVVVAVEMLALLAGAELLVHLILVRDIVDQPGAQRVLRQERPIVDQGADVGLVSSSGRRRCRCTICS